MTLKKMALLNLVVFALAAAFASPTAHAAPLDVVVPPPVREGDLRVEGQPGLGQRDSYEIMSCQTTADGRIVRAGCYLHATAYLGDRITLRPGRYRLMYEQTIADLDVRAGRLTSISLQKIRVPAPHERHVRFNVFWDLTQPDMQERYARSVWESARYAADADQLCAGPYRRIPGGFEFCELWLSRSYDRFRREAFTFHADAAFSTFAYYPNPPQVQRRFFGRILVNEPTEGEFISVFPGLYGLRFFYDDGRSEDVYGIDVR